VFPPLVPQCGKHPFVSSYLGSTVVPQTEYSAFLSSLLAICVLCLGI
jgi:hypothetical protein